MNDVARSAVLRLRNFADIAERMASQGVVVTFLKSGSEHWEIHAQSASDLEQFIERLRVRQGWPDSGPDVVRAVWDGRDKYLTIERSSTLALSAPNQWKNVECKRVFDDPDTEVLPYLEQVLIAEFK